MVRTSGQRIRWIGGICKFGLEDILIVIVHYFNHQRKIFGTKPTDIDEEDIIASVVRATCSKDAKKL
jgi:hypothetical protein